MVYEAVNNLKGLRKIKELNAFFVYKWEKDVNFLDEFLCRIQIIFNKKPLIESIAAYTMYDMHFLPLFLLHLNQVKKSSLVAH